MKRFAIYFTIAVSKMTFTVILILSTVPLLHIDSIVGEQIFGPFQLNRYSRDVNFDLSSLTKDIQIDGSGLASTVDIEQLRENILNTIFEDYRDRIVVLNEKIAAVGHDAEAILGLINEETGVNLFVVSNGIVNLNADSLASLVLLRANAFIRKEFKDNPLQQITLIESLRQQVREKTSEAKKLLTGVSLTEVESVIFSRGLKRSRRDITDVLQSMVKTILSVILSPIQIQINAFFKNATAAIKLLYIPTDQNNPFLTSVASVTNQVVIQVSQVIANAQQYINNIFDSVLQQPATNSTNRTNVRTRRDIDEEILLKLERFDVEVPHRRVTRSITDVIGTVWNLILAFFSPVFLVLNTAIKSLLVSTLTMQYHIIGNFITYPLRLIVQTIVNTIFPCNSCASIL